MSRRTNMLHIVLPVMTLVAQRVPLRQMLVRAITRRYRLSAFGMLWTVIVPLVTLGIYTFVFGVVMQSRWDSAAHAGTTGFSLYLFSGLIVFWLMAEVMGQAPLSIVEHTNLVKKAVFPLEIIPVVAVGNAAFHALVNIGVLLAALVVLEGSVPLTALLLPVVLLPFILLLVGFAWILAAVGVYFRDIVHMVSLLMTGMLFISPIFYSTSRLSPLLQSLIMANPVTFIVQQARAVLLNGQAPDWGGLGLYLFVAWLASSVGFAFFRHARMNFADIL